MIDTFTCPTNAAFDRWFRIGVASSDSLTDSDLQLFIETEQDQTRQSFIQ